MDNYNRAGGLNITYGHTVKRVSEAFIVEDACNTQPECVTSYFCIEAVV